MMSFQPIAPTYSKYEVAMCTILQYMVFECCEFVTTYQMILILVTLNGY